MRSPWFNKIASAKVSLLLVSGLLLRTLFLDLKPAHFDEGINGHFISQIWRDGFHRYDPTNFHGPLYFIYLHLFSVFSGPSLAAMRFATALLSVAFLKVAHLLYLEIEANLKPKGAGRCWGMNEFALLVLVLSPAFVFYGRYAIHETLFVLGQAIFALGRIRTWRRAENSEWITAFGFFVMATTKETVVVFLATWLIAELILRYFFLRSEFAGVPKLKESLLSIAATLLVYSGFAENFHGVADFFRAYGFWLATGRGASGHEKPMVYWVKLMAQYEWGLLLGLGLAVTVFVVGFWIKLKNKQKPSSLLIEFEGLSLNPVFLFWCVFSIGVFLSATLIPYKTPWLILGFWPMAVVLLGLQNLLKVKTVWLICLGLIFHDGLQSINLNFFKPTDPNQPYVYVQTTLALNQLRDLLANRLAVQPTLRSQPIHIMINNPWPLPFFFEGWTQVRYIKLEDYNRDVQLFKSAVVILVDEERAEAILRLEKSQANGQQESEHFWRARFRLRDAASDGWVFLNKQFFTKDDASKLFSDAG